MSEALERATLQPRSCAQNLWSAQPPLELVRLQGSSQQQRTSFLVQRAKGLDTPFTSGSVPRVAGLNGTASTSSPGLHFRGEEPNIMSLESFQSHHAQEPDIALDAAIWSMGQSPQAQGHVTTGPHRMTPLGLPEALQAAIIASQQLEQQSARSVKIEANLRELATCSICKGTIEVATMLTCNHIFCSPCISMRKQADDPVGPTHKCAICKLDGRVVRAPPYIFKPFFDLLVDI